jgi:hypothetical protein
MDGAFCACGACGHGVPCPYGRMRQRRNSKEPASRNSSGTQTARRMPFVPQDEPALQGRGYKSRIKGAGRRLRYVRRRRNCRSLSALGMTIVEQRRRGLRQMRKRTIGRGCQASRGGVVVTWGTGRNACATERRKQNSKAPAGGQRYVRKKANSKEPARRLALRNGTGSTGGA